MLLPFIRKENSMKIINVKNINLRTAEVTDEQFIIGLGVQEHKSKFLSKVENDLAKQQF